MRKIGIVALEEERITPKKRWYQFWKQNNDFEFSYIDEWCLGTAIVYLPCTAAGLAQLDNEQLQSWISQTEEFFLNWDIRSAVYSQQIHATLHDSSFFRTITLCDGSLAADAFLPEIMSKIAQNTNNREHDTLLYIDSDLRHISSATLGNLGRDWKYLSIATDNTEKAQRLADTIFDEYGLPIHISDTSTFVRCDVAVFQSGSIPKIPREALIVNISSRSDIAPKNKLKNKTINSLAFKINNLFPINIDNILAADALLRLGLTDSLSINPTPLSLTIH